MTTRVRNRDLTGQRFGSWRVIGPAPRDRLHLQLRWHCLCDCGERGLVFQHALLGDRSTGCGCKRLARRPIRVGVSLPPPVIAGAAASLFVSPTDNYAELIASMRASRGRRRQLGSMT